MITIHEEGGRVIDIIAGLTFDQHGEQTLGIKFSPDIQVKAFRVTIPNSKTLGELIPPRAVKSYAQFARERFGRNNANLWDDMALVGGSDNTVPTLVQETSMLLEGSTASADYSAIVPGLISQMKAYNDLAGQPERQKQILADIIQKINNAQSRPFS